MFVSICVITYQRPEKLRRLLQTLNELTFTKIECPEIEVIVVDNDTAGVAARVCSEMRSEFKWILKTSVESRRGITYARNKSVALASSKADFIAITDDDEIATRSWIENLLLAQKRHNSDIVTGPNLPYFINKNVPKWIVKGKFFDPPRWETGTRVSVAFTNNVLVKAEIFRSLNPVFDNRFALSGGEDAYLFLNLNKKGHKIVWADDAIMYDGIPASRTTIKWILLRGYRTWSNYSSFEKEMYPSFYKQFIRMLKGLALIIIGILQLIPSLFLGKAAIVMSLLYVFRGMGTLGGLVDIYYEEYKYLTPSLQQ